MNFDHYKTEDFLQNDSFVNYCLQRNASDVAFWDAYIDKHPHKRAEVEEALELYFVLNGNITRQQYVADQQAFETELNLYKRSLNNTTTSKPRVRIVAMRWLFGTAAAAAVAAIILTLVNPFGQENTRPSPARSELSKRGERRSFQLPDGSSVMLNSGSTLELAEGFNSNRREVMLDGEAFFEVTHMPDKPFVIKTKYLGIRVLGTVFNVKAYNDDPFGEATLLEGSVEVTLLRENNRKIILKPQEKVSYTEPASPVTPKTDQSTTIAAAEPAQATELSWTKNRLAFSDANFRDVANTLERWFDVNILFNDDEVSSYRFTATFEKQTINEILDALRLSRPFEYRQDGNNIYIEK
jgi:ferric-dicitrate binding protein FerR (iron transport regulator)